MASSVLFRCLGRGGSVIFKAQISPSLLRASVPSKTICLTPAAASSIPVPEYFRARRGPYTPEEKQGKHMMFASTHWKVERVLAVSMIAIMPSAFFFQGPVMDFVFTTSIFMHAFWAFDHVMSDYVQKFFPPVHKIWYLISIVAFAGLMNFNYNDVGVTTAIAMLWKL
ncbi:putative succinate dehydrogenase [ubiquinone] cytochrome b small subunit, mitochondrial [Mya arenaria]|uniref:putative succinate dehydrogenase [ubiquinone] cytochrome b small subunit, mitochondrial n=1 Tax=Mya arenaria TaxID=6604 RepID=UPI0022E0D6AC|nr:putative succinate dehydrogenase [ubiquinone] cytochrome b small subunit, mitochondrial [Mya arenaria]